LPLGGRHREPKQQQQQSPIATLRPLNRRHGQRAASLPPHLDIFCVLRIGGLILIASSGNFGIVLGQFWRCGGRVTARPGA